MNWLTEPFTHDFMQRALVGGALIGFANGFLGGFVVLRRLALMADALSHSMLPGLALGVMFAGGLTLSAILTLYLIPALYFKFVHDTALPYRGVKWKILNLIGIKHKADKELQYEMIAEEEEKAQHEEHKHLGN